jgi:hypothetical protein
MLMLGRVAYLKLDADSDPTGYNFYVCELEFPEVSKNRIVFDVHGTCIVKVFFHV